MTRAVLRASSRAVALATLALVAALVFRPVEQALALDIYVLSLGAIGLAVLVAATARPANEPARRSSFDQALRQAERPPERPPELARLEREVYLAVGSAFYLHYRLRPLLREIVDHRVGAAGPSARAELPEDVWDLIRADRPPPHDPHAPGIPLARLRTIVEALERMDAR